MATSSYSQNLNLNPINNHLLRELCGPCNKHLKLLEKHFDVQIHQSSNRFHIQGSQAANKAVRNILEELYHTNSESLEIPTTLIQDSMNQYPRQKVKAHMTDISINTKRTLVKPRGQHQEYYIHNIRNHGINFAIGPAGTGKTYLAVACAIEALDQAKVQRLVFVRPAVEAGEKLGFLPGELEDKVLPYLRPIYDALYDMLGIERINKLVADNIMEIAPLAYMRGRTLNDAFIILDEAQNTTAEQMKMFLTRIGFNSTAVITGDITQIDLPRDTTSGLVHSVDLLKEIAGISFISFSAEDAVRHPLVQSIIKAYQNDYDDENSD